ncbi:hypothetical protein Bccel_2728 [Pseudobacteroides cellulosolvens ATCC 35603 = DSM 2933]|uniref:Uncharacterized protein n=1 Tax=Pseudobacteroides cellulosolvens ATCC 35603 = DSM 2933 TaxID=398512 RepID=A0A0L6JQ00_9FIRM|nr:hypothetical protein Bccel_2728 [Pseudobacteroides cellulosolvens ATCC 35603 = DSM 2933]
MGYKDLRDTNFKAVWWFIPIIFAELFAFYGIDIIRGYPTEQLYGLRNMIIIGIISITLIAMSSVLFNIDRKTSSASIVVCIPYSENHVLLNKFLVGAYNIVAAFFMAYVAFNIILISQFCWKANFVELTIWTITTLLMYLFIFSFIMMVQSSCNSTWFGTLMTILVTALPVVIMALIFSQYFRYHLQSIDEYFLPVFPGFLPKSLLEGTIQSVFILILAFFGLSSKYYSFNSIYYSSDAYNNYSPSYGTLLADRFYCNITFDFIRCAVYIILTIGFIYAAAIIYRKNAAGKTNRFTGITWIEKLFKLIISFYIGCLMLYLIALNIGFVRLDFIIVFTLIVPIFIYKFVLPKSEKLFSNG